MIDLIHLHSLSHLCRTRISNLYFREQLCSALFSTCVRDFRFSAILTHNSRDAFSSSPLSLSCVVSITEIPQRSSDPLSAQKLAKGDVVKLHLGAHIDGFAAITAETIVVGATPENPVTGRRADALRAAWSAAEVAMRLVRVGNKNWQVTEAVGKVAAAWDCKPVEGAFARRERMAETEMTYGKECCRASRRKT